MEKVRRSSLTMPTTRTPQLMQLIADNSETVRFQAKQAIHVPGDEMDGVYYILEGRMRHYMLADDGTEKNLYTLSEGWFFGETAYFLHEPTGLYTSAETDMTLARIPAQRFRSLVDEEYLFREAVFLNVSKKMRILRYEVEDLSFYSCKDRLKRLLCSVADTREVLDGGWYSLKVRYTQYEIGTIIGSVRVTITKLLNELCEEGFIRILNRSIQVSVQEYQRFFSNGK